MSVVKRINADWRTANHLGSEQMMRPRVDKQQQQQQQPQVVDKSSTWPRHHSPHNDDNNNSSSSNAATTTRPRHADDNSLPRDYVNSLCALLVLRY